MYRGDCMKIKSYIYSFNADNSNKCMLLCSPVAADEFDGNESKYMTLCSSSNLSSSNKSTCEAFNKYLKTKNSELTKNWPNKRGC